MPELGSYGSVRGARGNSRPYREPEIKGLIRSLLTQLGACLQKFGATQHVERSAIRMLDPLLDHLVSTGFVAVTFKTRHLIIATFTASFKTRHEIMA